MGKKRKNTEKSITNKIIDVTMDNWKSHLNNKWEMYENDLNQIKNDYISIIKYAAKDTEGGMEELSTKLGYHHLYLYKVLKRNSLTALRRITEKIYLNNKYTRLKSNKMRGILRNEKK